MHALVVFESMYGNTQEVARAIADGLGTRMPVEVAEVGAAPTVIGDDVSLLVVGGPTHAHSMSKPDSRHSAAARLEADDPNIVSRGIGLREWLAALDTRTTHVPAAVFDTRITGPRLLWGSAAKAVEPQLRKAGAEVVVPAESFLIKGPRGPRYGALAEGELARAQRWGELLAGEVAKA